MSKMKVLGGALLLTVLISSITATHREFAPHEEGPYSEFTDEDSTRTRRSEAPGLEDKRHEYDKEQYWNQDEVEVEEEPGGVESEAEIPPPKTIKVRKVREAPHYEVFEVVDQEPAAQTRHEPQRFVYKGYEYERRPEQKAHGSEAHYVRGEQRPAREHYHAVPGAPGSPPASRYTNDDASVAESKHSHSSSDGGHHQHQAKHYSSKGGKGNKGYKSNHHNEHGSKGKEGHEKNSKHYDEHGGKKKSSFAEGGHGGHHHAEAHGAKGAKFGEKKNHDRGHNTKGYHNKYQKDEYHKEHKFYDDHHKSGHHARYGDFGAKHSKHEGGSQKKDWHQSGADQAQSGKKGHYDKAKHDEAHKGHKGAQGYEKQHAHHADYAKKGGHHGGNSYGYSTKH